MTKFESLANDEGDEITAKKYRYFLDPVQDKIRSF
jgi:hypothetical protein